MGNGFTEEMVQQAIELIRKNNSATATGISRELQVGYIDAIRILNELDSRGVIKRLHPTSRQFVVVQNDPQTASTKIGPFDIYLADSGWCVQEGDQIIKAGIPTLEGAVNVAEYFIGKEGKDGNE
jgi:hypothetical protein